MSFSKNYQSTSTSSNLATCIDTVNLLVRHQTPNIQNHSHETHSDKKNKPSSRWAPTPHRHQPESPSPNHMRLSPVCHHASPSAQGTCQIPNRFRVQQSRPGPLQRTDVATICAQVQCPPICRVHMAPAPAPSVQDLGRPDCTGVG